jgi:ATP-dependent Clp protease ATP-binding subunit ClpB
VAAVNRNVEAVKALLKAGADPNLGDEFISGHRTGIAMDLHAVDGNKLNLNVRISVNLN